LNFSNFLSPEPQHSKVLENDIKKGGNSKLAFFRDFHQKNSIVPEKSEINEDKISKQIEERKDNPINRVRESKRDSIYSEKLESEINTLTNNMYNMDIISNHYQEDLSSYSSGQAFFKKHESHTQKNINFNYNTKDDEIFKFNKEKIKQSNGELENMRTKQKHRNSCVIENRSKLTSNFFNTNTNSNILKNYSPFNLNLSNQSHNEFLYDDDILEEFEKELSENKWEITEKIFNKYKENIYSIATTQVGSRLLQRSLKFTKNDLFKLIALEVILLLIYNFIYIL